MMSPVEIFEYKQQWRPRAYVVEVHSDLEHDHKQWCRENLESHRWHFSKLVDNYTNAFMFENENDAQLFRLKFSRNLM